jgi:hypothetical protein
LSESETEEEREEKWRKNPGRRDGMRLELNALTFYLALVVEGVVAGLESTITVKIKGREFGES